MVHIAYFDHATRLIPHLFRSHVSDVLDVGVKAVFHSLEDGRIDGKPEILHEEGSGFWEGSGGEEAVRTVLGIRDYCRVKILYRAAVLTAD